MPYVAALDILSGAAYLILIESFVVIINLLS